MRFITISDRTYSIRVSRLSLTHVGGFVSYCHTCFFVAYCYGFRPQAAQWQNTSQILSLHDPAQQQSYTCAHVEQTRMVGCSQKVICPGCSVSLWVRVRVCGFFCAFAVEDTWEWVFAYVRLFACLKCPCLYGACQRSHGRRKHRVCADRRCQKWHCDSRHGNKCWHLILGDCNWSCRFGYNCARALWVVRLD